MTLTSEVWHSQRFGLLVCLQRAVFDIDLSDAPFFVFNAQQAGYRVQRQGADKDILDVSFSVWVKHGFPNPRCPNALTGFDVCRCDIDA